MHAVGQHAALAVLPDREEDGQMHRQAPMRKFFLVSPRECVRDGNRSARGYLLLPRCKDCLPGKRVVGVGSDTWCNILQYYTQHLQLLWHLLKVAEVKSDSIPTILRNIYFRVIY